MGFCCTFLADLQPWSALLPDMLIPTHCCQNHSLRAYLLLGLYPALSLPEWEDLEQVPHLLRLHSQEGPQKVQRFPEWGDPFLLHQVSCRGPLLSLSLSLLQCCGTRNPSVCNWWHNYNAAHAAEEGGLDRTAKVSTRSRGAACSPGGWVLRIQWSCELGLLWFLQTVSRMQKEAQWLSELSHVNLIERDSSDSLQNWCSLAVQPVHYWKINLCSLKAPHKLRLDSLKQLGSDF